MRHVTGAPDGVPGDDPGMDEFTEMEELCADAWPAPVELRLGSWRLRAADGFTGRANSALTLGDPGRPVDEALAEVIAFATAHGIRPAAHVVVGSAHEAAIAGAGWRVDEDHPGGAESAVLTASPRTFATPKTPNAAVYPHPPTAWWALTADAEPTAAQRFVLGGGRTADHKATPDRPPGTGRGPASHRACEVGFGVVRRDDTVVAAARAAVVGDLLHVARLAVRPEARRGGLARSLMGALGVWGCERGATRCALQVATGNTAALGLYAALGFTEHHRYRYWVADSAANHA